MAVTDEQYHELRKGVLVLATAVGNYLSVRDDKDRLRVWIDDYVPAMKALLNLPDDLGNEDILKKLDDMGYSAFPHAER
jgi:hypothetical protein